MNRPLPTALTDRIPQELFDKIISHLHISTYVLTTCALVCKAWLPSARYHLLTPRPPHAFAPVLIRRSTAPALLMLLSSPHCTLQAHIRCVCIRPGERVRLRRFAPPLLEGLERLAVCPASYGPLRDDLVGWVAGYAGSLAELVLVGVGCLSFIRFLGLLRELKGLRHVGIVDILWVDAEWEVDGVVRPELGAGEEKGDPVPHLRSVVLEDFSINVLNWLWCVRQRGVPEITSLDLRVDTSSASHLRAHTEQLMTSHYRTLGGTLQELDLYEMEHGSIDLQHAPHLQQIWFHGVTVGAASTARWVIDALQTIATPSSLRVVTLEVSADPSIPDPELYRGEDEEWVCAFDWGAFAGLLEDRARFPEFQRVGVELGNYSMRRASMVRACSEMEICVVEKDPGPRFGFLECGRVEERSGY